MDQETIEGIQRNLREAVQALALPSAEQVRVLSPGCITCELYEDFRTFYGAFVHTTKISLSQRQKKLLEKLADALDTMPEDAFECFNNKVLEQPEWDEIRKIATETLKALSWPIEAPAEFKETEPGVWRRISTDHGF